MGNKKIYLLTIEFDDETEEIEYIQEEIIDDNIQSELSTEDIPNKYWDEESLRVIRKYYTGDVGES
jgi:superfamily I DNA and RNA helicase